MTSSTKKQAKSINNPKEQAVQKTSVYGVLGACIAIAGLSAYGSFWYTQQNVSSEHMLVSQKNVELQNKIEELEAVQSRVSSVVSGVENTMKSMQEGQAKTVDKFKQIQEITTTLEEKIEEKKQQPQKIIQIEESSFYKKFFTLFAKNMAPVNVNGFAVAENPYVQFVGFKQPITKADLLFTFYDVREAPEKPNLLRYSTEEMTWVDYVMKIASKFMHITRVDEENDVKSWEMAMLDVEKFFKENKHEKVLETLNEAPLVSDSRLDELREKTARFIAEKALWKQFVETKLTQKNTENKEINE